MFLRAFFACVAIAQREKVVYTEFDGVIIRIIYRIVPPQGIGDFFRAQINHQIKIVGITVSGKAKL